MTDEPFQPSADELLAFNGHYVAQFSDRDLTLHPARHLAIVTCMDSRMDIFQMLGLSHGDAHIIRNAGGVVTDDVIRSLVLSQRFLGTREVILVITPTAVSRPSTRPTSRRHWKRRSASSRGGVWSVSRTRTTTRGRASTACSRVPSSSTRNTSAASSTTLPTVVCTKCETNARQRGQRAELSTSLRSRWLRMYSLRPSRGGV